MDLENLTNLKDIFKLLQKTNQKINSKLEDIINLDIIISSNNVEKLSNISSNLNNLLLDLDDIYLHIADNDHSLDKDVELIKRINSSKIDDKIKKIFTPYMFLMKINLENQN